MNQQKMYAFAMGLAMCFGVLLAPPQSGHAASSNKTTTSFSYSSKVVGNTVVISGNSTTSSSSSSTSKTTASKTPGAVKAPSSSKITVTTKSPAAQKQPVAKAPAKKPSASAPSNKPPISSSPKKPTALAQTKTVVNYFVPVKKPAIPTVIRLVPKPSPKATTKVILKTTPRVISPPKKITIKVPAGSNTKINSTSGEASFTPETITAAAFPPAVSVSDPVYLSAPASAHYRIGTILGKTAQVRFTPIDSSWSFGDGSHGTGLNPMHTFQTAGTFNATVAVKYQVSYRFSGETTWTNEAGQITLTDQVQISVSASANHVTQANQPVVSRPYLVAENCIKNPSAFAC